MRKFLFDTNPIIDYHRYYGPPVVKGGLTIFERRISLGNVISVREVLHELHKNTDNVYEWAHDNKQMFLNPGLAISRKMKELVPKYRALFKPFRNKPQADPWVLAHAVVSQEQDEIVIVSSDEGLMSAAKSEQVPIITLPDFMKDQKMKFKA